jgi:tetratricopeptide (TPR) repeat protein
MVTDRCDLAIATYQRALDFAPGTGRLYGRIARCKLFHDDVEAAKSFNAKEPVIWVRETNDLIILGREGTDEEWQAAVARYEEEYGYNNSYQMAEIYADKGDVDKVFEWLENVARVKDPGGPWALIMPFFDEAKRDPRWPQYEAKFGL